MYIYIVEQHNRISLDMNESSKNIIRGYSSKLDRKIFHPDNLSPKVEQNSVQIEKPNRIKSIQFN